MNYSTLKKRILDDMPLSEYMRIGGNYYKLIDNCVLVCFGIRRIRYAIDIQYSIYPLSKGPSFMGILDLKKGFIGQSAVLRYCQDNKLDFMAEVKKLILTLAKTDSDIDSLIRFAREVTAFTLGILSCTNTAKDCCALLMELYPCNENFRMVIPQEAVTVCQLLLLAKEREACSNYAREFRRKWEAGAKAQGHGVWNIPKFFNKYIDCSESGDYTLIHDEMLTGFNRMTTVLKDTKLQLTDKAINDFEASIAWMNGK